MGSASFLQFWPRSEQRASDNEKPSFSSLVPLSARRPYFGLKSDSSHRLGSTKNKTPSSNIIHSFQFFTYKDAFETETNFSAIYKPDFMMKVLDLQQKIEALKTEGQFRPMKSYIELKNIKLDFQLQLMLYCFWSPFSGNVSLPDVCHAPLAPDNPACIVWSVWSYWQDSAAEFGRLR